MKKIFKLYLTKIAILAAAVAFGLSQPARAAIVTFTGNDVPNGNLNWSDANNWSGGTPQGNVVVFPAAPFPASTNAADLTNNIVDQSMTISALFYNVTNTATFPYFDTTFFNPGVTLVSTGSIPLVVDGYPGSTEVDTTVNMAGTNYAFIVSNYTGIVWIGGTNAANVQSATFTLGDGTNIFDAETINLGTSDGGNGRTSTLKLGNGANTINATNIQMGLSKATGIIEFNGPAGSLTIASTNGPTSRASILMGDGTSGSGAATGELLLAGGYPVSVMASTLTVGECGADTGDPHGILTFDNGTVDVTTIKMGELLPGVATTSGNSTNNAITVGGNATDTATLIVNSPSGPGNGNFFISDNLTNKSLGSGQLIINQNGTVEAYCSIIKNGQPSLNVATNIINTGGTLILENTTNTLGTAASPIDSLTLDGTVELPVDGTSSSTTVNGIIVSASGATIDITSVVNVTGLATIPLISYNATDGDPFTGITTLTLPAGYTGSLVDNGSGTISLTIQPAGLTIASLLWVGTPGGTWDIDVTADWKKLNGGGSAMFTNQDLAAFDDTAANFNVTLNTNVAPGALAFTNNNNNYVISGTGSINGDDLTLFKNGSASLTLAESGGDNFAKGIEVDGGTLVLDDESNAISGGISIASGTTVQIGNNDANGSLPSGAINDNGALVFDHSSSATDAVVSAISGNGSLTLTGSGTVTLTAPNAYFGNTIANAGTLALTGSGTVSNSQEVIINNAGLSISTPLPVFMPNSFQLNSSTVTVAMATEDAPLQGHNLSMGGSGNVINVTALPTIAFYPSTLPLTDIQNGMGGYNMRLGTLPAGYVGSISESADDTEVLLTLSSGPIGTRASVVWNATNDVSANTNWSTAINWTLPGEPTPVDNVFFVDNGTAVFSSPFNNGIGTGPSGIAPGNINNYVDTSFTIGSLTYTNVFEYQNTLIANGDSLNIVSNGSLTVGSGTTDFGGGVTTFATIAGTNSTLDVNNTNGTIFVGEGSATASGQQATLDLSGLGTFNATVSRLLVGVGSSSEGVALGRLSGVLYLAQTNNITAAVTVGGNAESSDTAANAEAIDIGDADGNNSSAATALYLGQTNAIFADAIAIGRQKEVATMEFNPNFGTNTAYFRGVSASAIGTWSVGDGCVNSGSGENATGTNDFTTATGGSDGYVNILVDTMYVGRAANSTSGSGTVVGTLSFDNGVISAGTLYIGFQPADVQKSVTGTVNVGTNGALGVSGILTVSTNISIGVTAAGGEAAIGNLNISGGTVTANTITCGGTSTITLGANGSGGTLAVANTLGATGAALTALNLNAGTLQLDASGTPGAVTNVVATTITTSGTTTLTMGSLFGTSVGTYPLISYTGTDPYSSLTFTALPAGYTGTFIDNSNADRIDLHLTVVPAPPSAARFASVSISGSTLTFSATNGPDNGTFTLVESTNLLLPISQWTPVFTNSFNSSGDVNLSTNVVSSQNPIEFYLLEER
jgi:hypothetical protein